MRRPLVLLAIVLLAVATAAVAADFPTGQLIPDVKCSANASQSYALYLPSNYDPARAWPVIFAFDPAARGRMPVERYQAAAEKYGYIAAGSNDSRNGSWQGSAAAAIAMVGDVTVRFKTDEKLMYLAGMSGGARVVLGIALGNNRTAGVIASSAGFPDSKTRKTVQFPLFMTAGTEDFNLMEMRRVNRELTSPHRLVVFEGPHVWLSSELAVEAVEWMEIQAMKSGRKPRDEERIDRIFAARKTGATTLPDLTSLIADFQGLRDVSELSARAAEMGRDKHVREALKKEREEESREERLSQEIVEAEAKLPSADTRQQALAELRDYWKHLSTMANAPTDSADRRLGRRVLRGLALSVSERTTDPQYLRIVDEFRPKGGVR